MRVQLLRGRLENASVSMLRYQELLMFSRRSLFSSLSLLALLFAGFVPAMFAGCQSGHAPASRADRQRHADCLCLRQHMVVERSGGNARRVTSFSGQTSNPHSPRMEMDRVQRRVCRQRPTYTSSRRRAADRAPTWHPRAPIHVAKAGRPTASRSCHIGPAQPGLQRRAPILDHPIEGGVAEPLALPRGYQGKFSPDGTHIAYA